MNRSILVQVAKEIRKGAKFASFTYLKENGEESKRTVLFGAKMREAFEKRGIKMKGIGNWHTGKEKGKNAFWIKKGKDRYIRGVDLKDNAIKIFKISGITNFKCGN